MMFGSSAKETFELFTPSKVSAPSVPVAAPELSVVPAIPFTKYSAFEIFSKPIYLPLIGSLFVVRESNSKVCPSVRLSI
ncbi:hypothetical protein D3C87_1988670 [compost metagenome]